jgi:hypothetical protein
MAEIISARPLSETEGVVQKRVPKGFREGSEGSRFNGSRRFKKFDGTLNLVRPFLNRV